MTFTKPDGTRSIFKKRTKVCICLLAFLLCSSCKGSTRQERKLLRSFLFLTETEKQKGSCHKSWWRASVSLAVCSTESFQRRISLLEATGCFVVGQAAVCCSERMHLQGSYSKQGWLLPSGWVVAPVGGKPMGSALGPPLLWRL